MKKLDNLNKRDLISYRRLVEQVNNGNNEEYVCKYIPILVRFIEKNYKSDNSKIFELDDFIQECLIQLDSLKDEVELYSHTEVEKFIGLIYKNMLDDKNNDFTEQIYLGEKYDEIDLIRLDREKMLDSFRNTLSTDRQKVVFDCIREDDDVKDISSKLNISYSNAFSSRQNMLRKLKHSPEFEELYCETIDRYDLSYKEFILHKARKTSLVLSRLLEESWTIRFKAHSMKYKYSVTMRLLDFLMAVKHECIRFRKNNYYVYCINQDIQKLLSGINVDNSRLLDSNKKARVNEYIKKNRLH